MPRTRRKFSREFKIEAVRLVTEGGMTMAEVARDLDIRPNLLGRWKKQFTENPDEAFPGKGHQSPEQEELKRLREPPRV